MIRLSYPQAQFIDELFEHMIRNDPESAKKFPEVDEIRAQVKDQLAHPGLSVIDKIHELLAGRFARNVISGDVLVAVRKAILNPSELRKLDAENRTFACGGCGRRIDSGELVTFRAQAGDSLIFCVNCQEPELAPCSKCHQKRGVASSIHRLLGRLRITCNCKDKKEPTDANAVFDVETINPIFDTPQVAPPEDVRTFRHRTATGRIPGRIPTPVRAPIPPPPGFNGPEVGQGVGRQNPFIIDEPTRRQEQLMRETQDLMERERILNRARGRHQLGEQPVPTLRTVPIPHEEDLDDDDDGEEEEDE